MISETKLFEQAFKDKNVTKCIEHRDASFIVLCEGSLPNTPCFLKRVDQFNNEVGFQISNPLGKTIYLFAIDHCVYGDNDPKRCDSVLFDKEFLCFVELKLQTKGGIPSKNVITDAIEQLESTIQEFKRRLKENFSDFICEAYVVTRTDYKPSRRPSFANARVRFLEQYGVALKDEKDKIF